MISTPDSHASDRSSNLGGTQFFMFNFLFVCLSPSLSLLNAIPCSTSDLKDITLDGSGFSTGPQSVKWVLQQLFVISSLDHYPFTERENVTYTRIHTVDIYYSILSRESIFPFS